MKKENKKPNYKKIIVLAVLFIFLASTLVIIGNNTNENHIYFSDAKVKNGTMIGDDTNTMFFYIVNENKITVRPRIDIGNPYNDDNCFLFENDDYSMELMTIPPETARTYYVNFTSAIDRCVEGITIVDVVVGDVNGGYFDEIEFDILWKGEDK